MHRLFVAIRPPEVIRDQLVDAMDDGPEFRWQDEAQLHLTLRFIGEVERPLAEDIATALARIDSERFELRLAGVGYFEQRNGGALWAGLDPKAAVTALAAKIERACQNAGIEPERRTFHPHITLARWRGRRTREIGDFVRRNTGQSSIPFTVDQFILFESRLSRHGAHYEEVAGYALS